MRARLGGLREPAGSYDKITGAAFMSLIYYQASLILIDLASRYCKPVYFFNHDVNGLL